MSLTPFFDFWHNPIMSDNSVSNSNHLLGQSTSITLLQGIRNREPQHWERFVRLYSPLVYEWCRRAKVAQQDAADVTQEVFKAVAIKVDNFHRDRKGDTFRGWLWGITRFKILDHFRVRHHVQWSPAVRPLSIGGTS
ncbi:MAG: sigma-70 family RNA polymerase sigma factor [Pirellulaceae bacterium]